MYGHAIGNLEARLSRASPWFLHRDLIYAKLNERCDADLDWEFSIG